MVLAALVRMTVADSLRQPVTWLTTSVSLGLLGMSWLFGQFNFETEDRVRMLATAGVAVAVINGLFLAVVGASQAVHDELADRTALTLFAKPVGRGEFLLGKALGIWLTAAASCLVLALVHALLLHLGVRTGFELDELGHHHGEEFSDLWVPWMPVIAAHGLALAHTAVLTCLATVLALRLSLVTNILICFAIFVLSNVLAGAGTMGGLLLPALPLFNLDDSIQLSDHPVSFSYLLLTALYTALYCAGCLLTGLALFKRQDLA